MVCWGDNQPCAGAEASFRFSLLRGPNSSSCLLRQSLFPPCFQGLRPKQVAA